MKKAILAIIIIVLAGLGIYYFISKTPGVGTMPEVIVTTPTSTEPITTAPVDKTKTVIGQSSQGRDIAAFHFGSGTKEVLFVGGIHGGYEWNTVLVAYELMDYLKSKPTAIPASVKVTVIPVLNPDGLFKTVGTAERFTASQVPKDEATQIAGRFNASGVDLNRNFDCDWQSTGKWQNNTVSGGTTVFSEKESQAIRDYISASKPAGVVVWYSAAGGVFASNCHNGVSAETNQLTSLFATASGYPAYKSWDFYEVTGDMVNWLAKNGVPAISVLLTNHTDTEWSKNQKGVDALLTYFGK